MKNIELIKSLKKFSTATIHEAMDKNGALNSNIKPIDPNFKICGRARTVSNYPKDNLALHKIIELCNPGDIIVATMNNHYESGPWGEITSTAAKHKGIQGLVIDGSIRDTKEIIELGFPVFSRGSCIKGTNKHKIDSIGEPIICGGVLVNENDIIIGDRDGVVVVPSNIAEDTIKKAYEIKEKEKYFIEEIKKGNSTLDLLGLREKIN